MHSPLSSQVVEVRGGKNAFCSTMLTDKDNNWILQDLLLLR